MVLAAACAGAVSQAQAAEAPSGAGILDGVTSSEIVEFFNALGAEATDISATVPDAATKNFRLVQVSAGPQAIFYIVLRTCPAAGEAARCQSVEPFAKFDAQNVTLARVNYFNLTRPTVSRLALDGDGRLILGAKHVILGGVTPGNLGVNLGLFVKDIDTFVKFLQEPSGNVISYGVEDGAGAGQFALRAGNTGDDRPESVKVNWIGKVSVGVDPTVAEKIRNVTGQ